MGKPKGGELKLVRKRAISVAPKKRQVKSSKEKDVASIKIADGREKTVAKKISVTQIKEVDRKIEILKNITKRTVSKKKESTPSTAVLASRISLALMIPFRASLGQPRLISNVARYAGTAFVALGAFFTLYNMSNALYVMNEPMPAQTISSTCTSSSGWCPPEETVTVTEPTQIDPCSSGWCMPSADIKVESTTNALKDTVPVSVTVAKATSVFLVAYNQDTKTQSNIGGMIKSGDSIWKMRWDTTFFDDGTYKLRAIIKNEYAGTYTNDGASNYVVLNHPVDSVATQETTSGSGTTNSTTTSTSIDSNTSNTTQLTSSSTATSSSFVTTPTDTITSSTTIFTATTSTVTLVASSTLPAIQIVLGMSEPLMRGVMVKSYVTGASSVKVYARPVNAATSNFLGYASLSSTGEWRYLWDTARLLNGDYDLKVQALFPNGTFNTRTIPDLTIKNDPSSATTTTTTIPLLPAQDISTSTATTLALDPNIVLNLAKSNPLSKNVDIYISAPNATFVELYARLTGAQTPRFLGLAKLQSDATWRYSFDTTGIPNGSYELFVRAGIPNRFEPLEGGRTSIRIDNPIVSVTTQKELEYVETLRTTGIEVEKIVAPQVPLTEENIEEIDEENEKEVVSIAPSPYSEIRDHFIDEDKEKMDDVISSFREDIDRIIQEYGKALRVDDTETVRALQNELEQIRARAVSEIPRDEGREDMVTRINESLGTIIKDLRERTERSETLIKERVGDAVTKDSDRDGISDYDEVNLYGTDPFSADSDKDGFIDGIEILNGYDPKDSSVETNVLYESPREQGVVREDLLTVDQITTIDDPLTETERSSPKAYLAGKALPNSFVTLYMFSTPIVVTVKADSSGNWSYLFDKELEDGSHEVYVGITDNAGRIVAKSNPLSFVKTAEAFTPVDAEASAVVSSVRNEPSLMSSYALLIFGSLAVVSLGLVLILLGLHVRPKEEELQFA